MTRFTFRDEGQDVVIYSDNLDSYYFQAIEGMLAVCRSIFNGMGRGGYPRFMVDGEKMEVRFPSPDIYARVRIHDAVENINRYIERIDQE